MTISTRLSCVVFAAILAGCSGEPARLAIAPETSALKVRSAARSVSVAEVSLPAYAEAVEVAVQGENGLVGLVPGVIWADTPPRALTSGLVRNLTAITGAEVAAAPWPLDGNPDAELTVRVEQMLVTADGMLRLTGQYAVRRDSFTTDRSGSISSFEIAVPTGSPELADIARAHDAAWRQLAEDIARSL
ncbi:PqiC family protein [Actibacterium lipolyticum]|uniref:ABC-type transport auxiliary lipoprotein component domain-containing protein n=1 Tax=Actibacterium lipolyticum TaxID=1524263 RepID=A0A238KP84_9RHOB|nr:PqiC family protein [Actibacterium lipolyticum]SMX44460.1 hypothetical protein COL8621_02560 [Actibacterium lipolyticum]